MADTEQPDWLADTSDETFANDVLEASQSAIVVLDFWATWCQPCTMLSPLLEKVVSEHNGSVLLVKADTDLAPKAAAEYGVQSLPAVFAILDGDPVDGFQGLMAEEDLRDWLGRLVRHKQLLDLQGLEKTDAEAALTGYREILASDEDSPHANIGLARVLLATNDADGASEIIARLEERGFLEPEAERIKAQLSIDSIDDDAIESLRSAADSGDYDDQLKLAQALASSQQYDEACTIALTLIAEDRSRTGKDAHQLMLNMFTALPDDSEVTATYRRRLAMALY
jgi:putative thioredoxin